MQLTISARSLAYYATGRFCPLCAWIKLNVKNLPYQSFPAIFSSIDRYNKLIVQNHFQRENSLPPWLSELGEVAGYINPPHWTSFTVLHQETGITLRGEADGIFKMADGSYTIVDYKTSRYTGGQRAMRALYRAQLNAYAFISERLGMYPVRRLALVYMEPVTDEATAADPRQVDGQGFTMGFKAKVVDVKLDPDGLIPPLLRKAKEVSLLETPPLGLPGCKDCDAVDGLITALRGPDQGFPDTFVAC